MPVIGVAGVGRMGETPARRALRENPVAASGAIERHLELFLQHLKAKGFMTADHASGIRSLSGVTVTDSSRAGKALDAVEVKVDSGNHPDKGRRWLETFLRILSDVGECQIASDIAKLYGGQE